MNEMKIVMKNALQESQLKNPEKENGRLNETNQTKRIKVAWQ